MRWNVLFDELESRFEEITATQHTASPRCGEEFTDLVRASALEAKHQQEGCRIVLRSGRQLVLSPRTIGVDFLAGPCDDGVVDALIPVDSIVGIQSHQSTGNSARPRPTFIHALQLWRGRQQLSVLVVRGAERLGIIKDVTPNAVRFGESHPQGGTEWLWHIATIDMIRTLTPREEEWVRG
jgi:ribosomal protein L36